MDTVVYDVATVKEMLKEYSYTEKDIESQTMRLEMLETRMVGVGAKEITDMPRAPSPARDRLTDLIQQKDEIEADIGDMIAEQVKTRRRVEKAMKIIKNPDERNVIRLRYFDCLEWKDVAFAMFGNKLDWLEKEENYTRRMYKLHGSALYHLAVIFSEESCSPATPPA